MQPNHVLQEYIQTLRTAELPIQQQQQQYNRQLKDVTARRDMHSSLLRTQCCQNYIWCTKNVPVYTCTQTLTETGNCCCLYSFTAAAAAAVCYCFFVRYHSLLTINSDYIDYFV
jgi:hypothetical protein